MFAMQLALQHHVWDAVSCQRACRSPFFFFFFFFFFLRAHKTRQRTCTAFHVRDRCACVQALAYSLRTVLRHTFPWPTTC